MVLRVVGAAVAIDVDERVRRRDIRGRGRGGRTQDIARGLRAGQTESRRRHGLVEPGIGILEAGRPAGDLHAVADWQRTREGARYDRGGRGAVVGLVGRRNRRRERAIQGKCGPRDAAVAGSAAAGDAGPGAAQPVGRGIADRIVVVEVEADGARAVPGGGRDEVGRAATADARDCRAAGHAAYDECEIAGVDAADGLAEGHGPGHAAGVGETVAHELDGGDRGRLNIAVEVRLDIRCRRPARYADRIGRIRCRRRDVARPVGKRMAAWRLRRQEQGLPLGCAAGDARSIVACVCGDRARYCWRTAARSVRIAGPHDDCRRVASRADRLHIHVPVGERRLCPRLRSDRHQVEANAEVVGLRRPLVPEDVAVRIGDDRQRIVVVNGWILLEEERHGLAWLPA